MRASNIGAILGVVAIGTSVTAVVVSDNSDSNKSAIILPKIPGAVNRHVVQSNIQKTVCVKGYTKTIRPPVSYTDKLKRQQIAQLGYSDTKQSSYEEDHFIPLVLGGNPTSPKNLWPEPWDQARKSDKEEVWLGHLLCVGDITLKDARNRIKVFKRVSG